MTISSADHSDGAIYSGEVMHHRFRPRRHRFVYSVRSFLFDIDQLGSVAQRCRFFSLNRFNLYSLYFRDFGDGSGRSLRDYLQSTLQKHGISEPLQRAQLLCYPRILGYAFNPLSVYYCYNEANEVYAVLHEVSNTFGERHSYLIPVPEAERNRPVIRQHCDKNFYVSPFIPMDCRYHFRLQLPGERLSVAIRQTENNQALLHAVFQGQRRALNDQQLLRGFFALPLMTLKVTAAIHWQALKIFLKGIKLVPKSDEPPEPVSRIDQ